MSDQANTMEESGQEVATTDAPRPMAVFRQNLDRAMPMIEKLLPAHVSKDKFEAMVITAVMNNDRLLKCSPKSLMQSVVDAADLGLSLNRQMREADILPVAGEAQMRPRYEGLVKLAMQSGEVIDVYAHEVYANDHFKYTLGLNRTIEHTPAEGDRGALTQEAYCVWTTKLGIKAFEVIGAKRIARAKAASEGFKAYKAGKIKSTPWVDDEAQMIRKTAIRASASYMPKSTESDKFQRALAMADDTNFEEVEGGEAEPQKAIPPRPSRDAERNVAEAQRKEAADQDAAYRQTMAEEAPHDRATGEVTPPEPTTQAPTTSADAAPIVLFTPAGVRIECAKWGDWLKGFNLHLDTCKTWEEAEAFWSHNESAFHRGEAIAAKNEKAKALFASAGKLAFAKRCPPETDDQA